MKKILLILAALAFSLVAQGVVLAHDYNPYQEIYKKIAQQELIQGRVQFVYILKDENGAALAEATLKYLDYAGQEQTAVADAMGMVRLVFLQGKPFVQLREVVAAGQNIPVVGEDSVASAERKDFKEGLVEYYVLQKAMDRQVIHVFDAD